MLGKKKKSGQKESTKSVKRFTVRRFIFYLLTVKLQA